MYYAGESNVPGAPGQGRHVFNPNANVVGPIHSYNPNGVNTTGVNTTGYVGNTPQLTGFMNLPGAIGNVQGVEVAMGADGGPVLPNIPRGLRPANVPTDLNKGVRKGLTDPMDVLRGFKIRGA